MVARLGAWLDLGFLPGRLKKKIEAHLVTGLEMLLGDYCGKNPWSNGAWGGNMYTFTVEFCIQFIYFVKTFISLIKTVAYAT